MPEKMEVTQEFEVYNLNEVDKLPNEDAKKIAVGNLKEIIDDNTNTTEKLNKLVRIKFTSDGHLFDLNTFKGVSSVKNLNELKNERDLEIKMASESLYKDQQPSGTPQAIQKPYFSIRNLDGNNRPE